jgi:hypothetical protein
MNEGFIMERVTYPVQFSVDYPDRPLNRLTTFFRIFMVIPIAIVLGAVDGGNWQWTANGRTVVFVVGAGGLLFFLNIALVVAVIIAWFAILFTAHYPRGLFDFVEGVIRWNNRVLAYAFVLVTDRYPPFRLSP